MILRAGGIVLMIKIGHNIFLEMRAPKQIRLAIIFIALLLVPAPALAQSSSSSNYRVDQTFFGSGGELNACSTGPAGYCSKQTAGELGIGNTSSAHYQIYAGFNTTDDPYIEFVVTGSNIDLGYLDTSAVKTANGAFYVRAWQAGGYVVRTEADPPTNPSGGHQLTPLSSPTASSAGTEQFGMNLVANTSPATFGTDPQQVPDNTFSFGTAAAGYNTTNQYKYAKGDIVAQATKSTSVTIYTVSYIFNINDATPAGQYNFAHNLVATGTY
jgi:hypothetical protein